MSDPAEVAEMQAALVRLRRNTGVSVVFGGLLHDTHRLRIAQVSGARTSALQGLGISAGNGLGGKSIALSRPCGVTDYRKARHISHEYDAAVTAEGLCSVLAVPVVVRRRVRGVLYGAMRQPVPLGDRIFDAAVAAARDVEQALVVRDEVRQLLTKVREPDVDSVSWEKVREAYGELRALAPLIGDPALRETILSVCTRLSAAGVQADQPAVALTPREVDVLACVASGATNASTAQRLGLRPETVKGYLRDAMRKLGAHTRLEAVVAARRAGVLP
ncbi:LuxR C-terminal-related transcriptional regulator [Streptomyces sp. NPDC047315]|uniref:response regulator transcription factor n=1 Tax=Streptomyces sp. NPDC047315 TaxID=3155142 RepID=UPI0033EB408B